MYHFCFILDHNLPDVKRRGLRLLRNNDSPVNADLLIYKLYQEKEIAEEG